MTFLRCNYKYKYTIYVDLQILIERKFSVCRLEIRANQYKHSVDLKVVIFVIFLFRKKLLGLKSTIMRLDEADLP